MVAGSLGVADAADGGGLSGQESAAGGVTGGSFGDEAGAKAAGYHGEDAGEVVAFEGVLELDAMARADGENLVAEAVAFAEKEHAFAAEEADGNGGGGDCGGVSRVKGDEDGFAEEVGADDFRVANGECENGEVDLAGAKAFDEVFRGAFGELEVNERVFALEGGNGFDEGIRDRKSVV